MARTKIIFAVVFLCFFSKSFGQFSVGYHQSVLPFVSVGYEIGDRFSPELRIGTDVYLEDFTLEAIARYDFVQKENHEFYAGLGGLITNSGTGGVIVPVGFVFYPFEAKRFGFHMEVAPVIKENSILRGSWGIRYKFGE